MDADGNLIPIVEDDQGEGYKDIVDATNEASNRLLEQLKKQQEKLTRDKHSRK